MLLSFKRTPVNAATCHVRRGPGHVEARPDRSFPRHSRTDPEGLEGADLAAQTPLTAVCRH